VTFALLLTFSACGPAGNPRGSASGKVTLGGKPVTRGSVVFEGADGKTNLLAPIGADGSFSAGTAEGAGLPVGDYAIGVSPIGIAATIDAPPLVGSAPTASNDPPIPEKYVKPSTSGWKVTIKQGTNPPIKLEMP